MAWSGEHRAFVIEEFVKNGESVVATQRSSRRHFSLNRHDPVPTEKTNNIPLGFQLSTNIIGIKQEKIWPSKNKNSARKRHSCGRLN